MPNGTDGLRAVYEVDRPADRAVRGRPFRLAKFGHGELGPSGRRVLAAPDGGSLYAAGEGGVVDPQAPPVAISVDGLALTPMAGRCSR